MAPVFGEGKFLGYDFLTKLIYNFLTYSIIIRIQLDSHHPSPMYWNYMGMGVRKAQYKHGSDPQEPTLGFCYL